MGHDHPERLTDVAALDDGSVRLRLDEAEAVLLQHLVSDLRALLSERNAADPVDRRLFPDASESRADAESFRALVEDDLVAGKLQALASVDGALGRGKEVDVALRPPELEDWLRALTDLRLTLGVRLGVDEETMAAEPDARGPDGAMLLVLHWLGLLQETILAEMTGTADQ